MLLTVADRHNNKIGNSFRTPMQVFLLQCVVCVDQQTEVVFDVFPTG